MFASGRDFVGRAEIAERLRANADIVGDLVIRRCGVAQLDRRAGRERALCNQVQAGIKWPLALFQEQFGLEVIGTVNVVLDLAVNRGIYADAFDATQGEDALDRKRLKSAAACRLPFENCKCRAIKSRREPCAASSTNASSPSAGPPVSRP